jgi:hypothetical protein
MIKLKNLLSEVSYEKSGLKNPKLADRDKDDQISSWEKKVGKNIEKNIDEQGDTYNIGMKRYTTSKPKLSQNETEKTKGVDGTPCWRGYRYAGTENGKDKCVRMKENEMCEQCGGMMYEGMCMECDWDMDDQESSYEGGYEHDEQSPDHEVGMAQNLLKDIISNASQLMDKIGEDEFNLPGWIQDHISQAQNFINQANTGYHEL